MESSSSATPRSSNIPRLSKLPLPRCLDRPSSNHGVIANQSPPKLVDQAVIAAPRNLTAPAPAPAPSSSNKPANEVGLQDRQNEDADHAPIRAQTLPRRPRPSLSDRAIETLAQIPPTPSPRRRRSSFFPPESPLKSTSRPGSSLSRSRPGTSHEQHPPLPPARLSRPASPVKRLPTLNATPSRRSISSHLPKNPPSANVPTNNSTAATPSKARPPSKSNVSPTKEQAGKPAGGPILNPQRRSKTLAARPSKTKPSLQGAFKDTVGESARQRNVEHPAKPRNVVSSSSAGSSGFSLSSPFSSKDPSLVSSKTSDSSTTNQESNLPKANSSAALRETIAKAKAARLKANQARSKDPAGLSKEGAVFPDIDLGDASSILRKRVASARTDGRLNIAALRLSKMPPEVLNMYSANIGDGAWYESVDLVRLIAADNDFEQLDDAIFPDVEPRAHAGESEYQGNLFGGLETLDLHGNQLKALNVGLRRLERLTTLNLSKNKLTNDCISTISQIPLLRELRLAENTLNGSLGNELCDLKHLEVLDLHDNRIHTLPGDLERLSKLRTVKIAGNKLKSLPFTSLGELPLVELDVARNSLTGVLFPRDFGSFEDLKFLDIANNALTALTEETFVPLPSLQTLNVSENRLTALSNMAVWTDLITLSAGGNQISALPEGLTNLRHLKSVDFSRNDLKRLDERIGLMENLTVINVANNPLRDRRFLRMDTADIKQELKVRLMSETGANGGSEAQDVVEGSPSGHASNAKMWIVQSGGIVDRSSAKLDTIDPVDLEPFIGDKVIKSLMLGRNNLPEMPQAVELLAHSLTRLDLSNNKLLGATYLRNAITLPSLRSLDLSSNAVNTLLPIADHLDAPKLAELDVSRNRLTSLLPLRRKFPSLTSLLAADNSISVLEVDVATGLEVLDISGNELTHLEPRIGLLDAEGLRTLLVGGNRFRVPRREIIDRGTEAILSWLKSRIPEGETLKNL
ncbi:hypothetical protein ACLMJK_004563 [Lecanora helva]